MISKSPLVSIIIPCYNQEKFLMDTYLHLKEMIYTNWECIIINDGSTDNSLNIIQKISTLDSRIIYYSKENGGTASARNLGLSIAKGSYIQFLDADDYLDINKIEKQVLMMENGNLEVSYTNSALFFYNHNGNKVVNYASKESCQTTSSLRNTLITRWGIDFSIPIHSWLFLASFLKNHNIKFDDKFRVREDWNFHLLVSSFRPRIGYLIDYVGSYYRMNPEGKTSSYLKISKGNYQFIYRKTLELNIKDKLLFCYRLSCELWQTILRSIKYKRLCILSHPYEDIDSVQNVLLLIGAIIIMPLSFFRIFKRFIREYLG